MDNKSRRDEYLKKGKQLFDDYLLEHKVFMKQRRAYSVLDQGVNEENQMRKRYNDRVNALAEEYSDVLLHKDLSSNE